MSDDIPVAKVVKEPTVTAAPPSGRKFPCPSCGARLDFDPTARGLKCPYCGYEQKIERGDKSEVVERDFADFLDREEAKGKAIPGRSSEVRCTGCGANVLLEDNIATERCPFCATHLENKPEAAHAMIPPESVLPFAIDVRGAREAFNKWLHSLWFAPNALKKLAALGQLSGVYMPHWTYDAMTVTFYEGQRGDNYTTTEWYTDSNGKRQSRTVIRTRWSWVSGEVRHFFDDVLVCGSHSLPADLLSRIDDWHLPKLEPFRPDYLSGFRTERYSVGLREGYKVAKVLMEPTIRSLICRDIGGDHQRIDEMQTRYSAVTFKPLLLPLWVAVYRYHEKTYQILVNGRTGKVGGYRPWSFWKLAACVTTILLAIACVVVLIMIIQGR